MKQIVAILLFVASTNIQAFGKSNICSVGDILAGVCKKGDILISASPNTTAKYCDFDAQIAAGSTGDASDIDFKAVCKYVGYKRERIKR